MDNNNCQKKIPDCFHPKGLKQIGVNPYTQSPQNLKWLLIIDTQK